MIVEDQKFKLILEFLFSKMLISNAHMSEI